MKLERLNDNQIRFTLGKSDLDKRKLQLSELAYGSDKARELFRDLIRQASEELGFEAEDIPLMIEAIPVSSECLILIVTKVEDPDELDTRFSRFSSPSEEEDGYEEPFGPGPYEEDAPPEEEYTELPSFPNFPDMGTVSFEPPSDEEDDGDTPQEEAMDIIAPFTQAIAQAKKEVMKRRQESSKKKSSAALYSFPDLDTVIRLSSFLTPFYTGENSLYRVDNENVYYLFLTRKGCSNDIFKRACVIASDYGTPEPFSYATMPYLKEHAAAVFPGNALSVLNQMNG